ncbi:MAG TPA: transglycosylase SLT domain-containing protein [Pyrinomonadaceae bacterium]|jgi:soluble lytic murein transglycosylase|nr:transglycosylase SLT domain-containing protein [Pyrinomonadaceae bacterium]
MALFTQQTLVCFTALLLSLSCARIGSLPNANGSNNASDAPPDAPPNSSSDAPESFTLSPADQTDEALAAARRSDAEGRSANGQLPQLTPQEHMRRAAIYQANRAFDEARAHWRALIERYPTDPNVPAAYFGIGRTLFQERRYEEALPVFQKLGDTYQSAPAGRDGFYYVAATLLRLNRPSDAAARYAEYVQRFPNGERIDNAYLNIIDSLREAGRSDDALPWIERTRARFRGTPNETSAVFARLRLDVARGDWASALSTCDELSRMSLARGVNTSAAEIAYLRAFSLEESGQKDEAIKAYEGIGDGAGSYSGWRATERLKELGGAAKSAALAREARVAADVRRSASDFPTPFRDTVLRAARQLKIDPRLVYSIMRAESGYNPRAKSGAGARGLLQMTPDMAAKYAPLVRLSNVSEQDLFRPDINILVGTAYLSELNKMFPDLPEAVAASYNGGEENVARWVVRAVHKDPGVFTAEVGFNETKDYVNKVMSNYRAYRILFTEDLSPRR